MTIRQILTKRSLLVLIAASAGLAIFLNPNQASAGVESTSLASTPNLIPVGVTSARQVEGWNEQQSFTGTIRARRSSQLGFESEGKIVEFLVDAGSLVQQGDPLARLDQARLDLQHAEATAAWKQELSKLEEALAGPRQQTIEQGRAALLQLEAESMRLERETARRKQLLAKGVSAEEEFESLRYTAQAMAARVLGAKAALDELESGTRLEQIAAQRAAVALARARVDQLELEMERSTLRAPYSGTVLQRHADEGEVVAAGSPVLYLQESGALEAHLGVPEDLARKLVAKTSYQLHAGKKPVAATLRAALPEIDAATRSRTLIFDLDASSNLAGATLVWRTEVFRKGSGHALPQEALVPSRRGLWAVYLVISEEGSDVIRRQEVEVLHAGTDEVIVRGLQDTDRVIRGGTDRVVPGQQVRALEED